MGTKLCVNVKKILLSALCLLIIFGTVVTAHANPNEWLVPWEIGVRLRILGYNSPLYEGRHETWEGKKTGEKFAFDLMPDGNRNVRIYAPTGGTIERLTHNWRSGTGYGNHLIMRTDCGELLIMAHFSSISQTVINAFNGNKRINRRDFIGVMGNSGTGEVHLHFEIASRLRTANFNLFGRSRSFFAIEATNRNQLLEGGIPTGGSQPTPDANVARGNYNIQLAGSNLYIDMEFTPNRGNQHNGVRLITQTRVFTRESQSWEIIPIGNGLYRIMSLRAPGKAMEIQNGDTRDGARVQTWDYRDNLTHQRWRIVRNSNNTLSFINARSGKALDLFNGIQRDGNHFHAWSVNGTAAQQFNLIRTSTPTANDLVARGTYNIQLAGSNMYIDMEFTPNRGNQHNGVRLITQTRVSTRESQSWEIIPTGNGLYRIMSVRAPGKAIEIQGGSSHSGAIVQTWDYHDNLAHQKWRIVRNSNGTFTFLNAGSGKALDLFMGLRNIGNHFHAWTPNGTAAQQFDLVRLSSTTINSVSSLEDEELIAEDSPNMSEDDISLADIDEESDSGGGCTAGATSFAVIPLMLSLLIKRRK